MVAIPFSGSSADGGLHSVGFAKEMAGTCGCIFLLYGNALRLYFFTLRQCSCRTWGF
jgi:hypothetical protein